MTAEASLVGILILLYLLDSAVIAGRDSRFFVGWKPGAWASRRPFDVNLNGPRLVAFGTLLPMLYPCVAAGGSTLDTKEARRRLASLNRHGWPLLVLNNVLFLSLFIALPAVLLGDAFIPFRTIVVVVVLCIWLITVGGFLWTRRKVLGASPFTQRVFTTIFSPLALVRGVDCIAQQAFSGFHPLALAAVLCSRDELASLARKYCFPLNANEPIDPRVDKFLNTAGLREAVLAAPPREPGAESYCPRCWCQYGAAATACADCEGRALTRY